MLTSISQKDDYMSELLFGLLFNWKKKLLFSKKLKQKRLKCL
jgi:hypothetical protein